DGAAGNYVLRVTLPPVPTPTVSTRLYFGSEPPAAAPAVNGAWQETAEMARYQMGPAKSGGSTAAHSASESDPSPVDVLVYQFTSPPLSTDHQFSAAADTVRVVPGVQASDAALHASSRSHLWVTTGETPARRCLLADAFINEDWPVSPAVVDA